MYVVNISVSVFDKIKSVCFHLHYGDRFTQWQKETGQQHGKGLPVSGWYAAEKVVPIGAISAIYGTGHYINLKFSIMSNVSNHIICMCGL